MSTVRICYGDEFTTECGFFYVAITGTIKDCPLFYSQALARQDAILHGHTIDDSYDLFGNKKIT